MEKVKGFDYTIEGFKDIDKFAKGILALVNMQSSRKDTIVEVKTFEATNIVSVISLVELDGYLESHVGEITDKDTIEIVRVDFEDLKDKGQKVVTDCIDKMESYFLTIEND